MDHTLLEQILEVLKEIRVILRQIEKNQPNPLD